jgi:hypothetical protein
MNLIPLSILNKKDKKHRKFFLPIVSNGVTQINSIIFIRIQFIVNMKNVLYGALMLIVMVTACNKEENTTTTTTTMPVTTKK